MVLAGGGWRPQGDDSGSSRLKLLLALRAQRGHVGWAAFSFEAEVAVRAKAHHEPTVRSPEQWFPRLQHSSASGVHQKRYPGSSAVQTQCSST